jgi:NADPH:quinone reductase-like Zn-dependent oxidoreductase
MKAFLLDRYGKEQALRLGDLPEPELNADDVLVEVHAAGLNPLDARIRDGAFKPILPYRPPFVLGHDLAGVVVRVGPNVRTFKPGDEVYGRPRDGRIGTLAERIAVDAADLALKPRSLDMVQAASVPLAALTAWQVLVERGDLKTGQKVFIQAGSGGVGVFAIQLAKHLGAEVATTTSTANVDLVAGLGADHVIDYRKQQFEDVLSGYDLVLNSLDGETLEKSLGVLSPGGKLVSISGPPDPAFAKAAGLSWGLRLALGLMSRKVRAAAARHGVGYAFLFMHADGARLAQIADLIDAGAVKPVVDRVFPFDAANEALTYLGTGRARGKVVVRMK